MPDINRSEFDKNFVVTWNWWCPSCGAYQTKYGSGFETDDSVICDACCGSFSIIEDNCDE